MSARKYFYVMDDITGIEATGMVCGDALSETYQPSGYYSYPQKVINIHNTTVNINWDVTERPNRFTIYKNGSFLTTSGWAGVASYPGPWGSSLSTSTVGSFSYAPEAGYTYTILVEVGNASNVPAEVVSDSYYFSITCNV